MNAARRYAQTQNATASKERLMLLLFQTALRHIRGGIASLDEGRKAEAVTLLTKASDIVVELNATLDHGQAPELCAQLSGLYLFTTNRLVRASASGNAELAREAERAFAPIVEAFTGAVEKLGAGQ